MHKPSDDVNVLDSREAAPLYDNMYIMEGSGPQPNDENYEDTVILFRDAADNKVYFLYKYDDFETKYPFDTIKFEKSFYPDFYDSITKKFISNKEFFINEKNLFDDINLDPRYIDKETGEIKSYFKYDGTRLFYQSNGQKFYREQFDTYVKKHRGQQYLFPELLR